MDSLGHRWPLLLLQWLICLLLLCLLSTSISAITPNKIPRLTPLLRTILRDELKDAEAVSAASDLKDFETYFYDQTLDHFNYNPESYTKFKQRYVINSKFWGGAKANAPIFAYFGAEEPIDGDLLSISFLSDNAPRFHALLVYIEHRYYGKSVPFGSSLEEALKNNTTRGYFNSAQALADYADILIHVKRQFSAPNSPIIIVGGSYGGMLASWFRLKYPHIALGALASSAPILYFDDITPQDGYYSKVTADFKEASNSCYQTIRKSWSEIDKVAAKPNGLSILSQRFKTCSPLKSSFELKDYLDAIYTYAAQYNEPPSYPVTEVCGGIDGAPKGTDVLSRIFAGVVAFEGNNTCYNTKEFSEPSETSLGWGWQTCSEMVIPVGRNGSDTNMFPPSPFILDQFIEDCIASYGVSPRPHWVTTYYGGHDIKLILQRFASNIIFSNGLRDPYSTGGVLQSLSKSLHAIYTSNGSHCLDIVSGAETDPSWLVAQREAEIKIIQGWLKKYYADLLNLKNKTNA